MLTLIIAATIIAAAPADTLAPLFDFLVKVAPLLAALGLWSVLAKGLGMLWDKLGGVVAQTPTKIDDFAYHLVDPAVQEVKRLIAAGDVEGAHQKLDAITALAKATTKA